jgi:hypothetical protein
LNFSRKWNLFENNLEEVGHKLFLIDKQYCVLCLYLF